jgi:uncharacterized protein YciI
MSDYLYLIQPSRHDFFDSPTSEEIAIMDEHFAYLKKATEAGIVLLAGPCTDNSFGLVIFRAESDDSANAFMDNDPSIRKKVMAAELHPLRISLRK